MKKIIFVALIILAVAAIISARLGWWPVNATATPPRWEVQSAQSVLQASLKREAQRLNNPLQPTNDVLIGGMKLFKMNCAGCHGQPGQPSPWGTRGFYPRVPQFGDQPPNLSAPQMFVAIKYGSRYSGMGAWDGMMPDEDIWKVATFLEHIGSLPPEVQANWKTAQ